MIHFCSSYNSCAHRKSIFLRWKSSISKSSDFLHDLRPLICNVVNGRSRVCLVTNANKRVNLTFKLLLNNYFPCGTLQYTNHCRHTYLNSTSDSKGRSLRGSLSDVMTLSPPKCTCRQSKGDNMWREISKARKIYVLTLVKL